MHDTRVHTSNIRIHTHIYAHRPLLFFFHPFLYQLAEEQHKQICSIMKLKVVTKRKWQHTRAGCKYNYVDFHLVWFAIVTA